MWLDFKSAESGQV